jgi:hypothetical protein
VPLCRLDLLLGVIDGDSLKKFNTVLVLCAAIKPSMFSVFWLSVIILCIINAECLNEAYNAKCHYAKCLNKSQYAECHLADCRN